MSLAIEGVGVVKSFPPTTSRPAVDIAQLQVQAGQITGLVGPDGAGKTTLLRLLAGLMVADSGSLCVCGHDPKESPTRVHECIGYMPQKFGLYEDLSVIENMRLYAHLRHVPAHGQAKRFDRLLTFTGLRAFSQRLAGKLSGGMKQKLGLACAMMGSPEVLLLDEPSVGVDPVSRRELWRMVQELVGEGLAVVWATSYLDEAEQCDSVLLLHEGRKIYDGAPDDLLDRVANRVKAVVGIRAEQRRPLLMQLLQDSAVTDGVLQGDILRIVLREYASPPMVAQGYWQETLPRFEDACIDILGGGCGGYSAVAESMPLKAPSDFPAIEAHNLTKRFGHFVAVNDVSFSVQRGEIFGLLGPNGAGKSTSFRMMCGLLQPTQGQTAVMGLSLQTAPSQARARIGYMAQRFSLYGQLTVQENLSFFAGLYGLSRQQRQEQIGLMIEVFALHPYIKVNAQRLPLGFMQRLALACSIMHQPDVLFLDEPTSGVDPVSRREFWTHINAMVEKGVTVLVTTHFMDEAEYCDRISLMYRGCNIATGTPDALKQMVRSASCPEPTMEDAFIGLVERDDAAQADVNTNAVEGEV